MLLIGILVFSFINGSLLELIFKINQFNIEFNDGDNLKAFFGTLTRFN
jgi:hypothetical protein